jgi:hypothetical protein
LQKAPIAIEAIDRIDALGRGNRIGGGPPLR